MFGAIGNAISAVTSPISGIVGGVTGGLTQGFSGPRPELSINARDTSNQSADRLRQQYLDELQRRMGGAPTVQAPQITPTNYAPQQTAMGLLQSAAQGNQPSVASIQQQQGLEQALRQQMALANSARGGVGGQIAAAKSAQDQGTMLQQQQINNAATLRAQEMANAQGLFANAANQGANMLQDYNLAQAQLNQQANQLNQQSYFQNAGLTQNALAGLGDAEKLRLQGYLGDLGAQTGLDSSYTQSRNSTTGGLLSGAGSLLAMSDKRAKKDIKNGNQDAQSFLDAIGAHSYSYKDKKHGEGKFLSPMAQELEKTMAGKQMVVETPEGKMVNYSSPAGYGAILASLGHLNEEMKKIKGGKYGNAA